MTIELSGAGLTLEDVAAVARGGETAVLSETAWARMAATRQVVTEALERDEAVYGLTTGVAERKQVRLSAADRAAFNRSLIAGHLVGQGPLAPPGVVRGALLCLANTLAKGVAGVRPELADLVLSFLDDPPPVRQLGSVGQADLGPMADIADGLLSRSNFELAPGEALALLNNNAFATSSGALALVRADELLDSFDVAGALDLEALRGNLTILHPVVAETRPFPGLAETLSRLRVALEGSYLGTEGVARNLQDPLTFRCLPQIHGAARDALSYARSVLEIELNSSQGNPVVVLDERRLLSVGNFDVGPTAAALDFARLALAPVITSASERSIKLLQRPFSGLTSGLAATADSSADALAELAITSQAIAVEARTLVQPVSFELSSTTKAEGIEDRTTMAPLSARRLSEMLELAARVLAIELVVACQAVDLRGDGPLGARTSHFRTEVRRLVSYVGPGELIPPDLESVVELVRDGALSRGEAR